MSGCLMNTYHLLNTYHLPCHHCSIRGVQGKKENAHPFIVASFNTQSVKGSDMACKRCDISTFVKDIGVDLPVVSEKCRSASGDYAKSVELAPH